MSPGLKEMNHMFCTNGTEWAGSPGVAEGSAPPPPQQEPGRGVGKAQPWGLREEVVCSKTGTTLPAAQPEPRGTFTLDPGSITSARPADTHSNRIEVSGEDLSKSQRKKTSRLKDKRIPSEPTPNVPRDHNTDVLSPPLLKTGRISRSTFIL